jgi:cell division septum initiation protein DivIVA
MPVESHALVAAEPPRFVPPTHGGVDILKLLTELEDMVENAKHVPMLKTIIGFDEDKFHMTVMKIRANLPEEMKRASKLARESERIVEEARDQASRLVEETRKAALLEFERGRAEATRARAEAQAEAQALREEAQTHARRMREESQAESASIQEAAHREAAEIQEAARAAADQILAEARTQAVQMVSDSEIVRRAEIEARQIVDRAAQEAMTVRRGADDYARDMLGNLEAVLAKALGQVQHGREFMDQNR